MAPQFLIKVKFTIHKQPDGTLVATAAGLPVVVVAKSERELDSRITVALESLAGYLSRIGEDGVREFLGGPEVMYEEFGGSVTSDREERELTVPVLVGAS